MRTQRRTSYHPTLALTLFKTERKVQILLTTTQTKTPIPTLTLAVTSHLYPTEAISATLKITTKGITAGRLLLLLNQGTINSDNITPTTTLTTATAAVTVTATQLQFQHLQNRPTNTQ
jgi:hypothetical protein